MGKYVEESLGKGETIKYSARISLWRYLFNFIFGGFLTILSVVDVISAAAAHQSTRFAFIRLIVGICLLAWPLIARRSTELVITDKRLIAKFGVLSTQSIEIRFDKIESVRVNQGLMGRILNFGDIVVTGTGSTFDPIRHIASAMKFRAALNQAMEPPTAA
jgi:uncharacterized membrane protein YdbT with pleckstrin-like domain